MSWVKLDDRFAGHPKVRKAWKRSRASIGLYVMAVTYCAQHETDGVVDLDWADDMLPQAKERDAAIEALVTAGLMHRLDDERLEIHDYLEHNESREQAEARREKDRERKARGGKGGKPKPPPGVQTDSARNPNGVQAASGSSRAPVPSRPVHSSPPNPLPGEPSDGPTSLDVPPPSPPSSGRKRDQEAYEEALISWSASVVPEAGAHYRLAGAKHALSDLERQKREPTGRAVRWLAGHGQVNAFGLAEHERTAIRREFEAIEFARQALTTAQEINEKAAAEGAAA